MSRLSANSRGPTTPRGWRGPFSLCRLAVGFLAFVLILATAVPLLRSNVWWIRIFDYPRIQIASLTALTLAGYVGLRVYARLRSWEYVLAALAILAMGWQILSLAPYTRLYPHQTSDSSAKDDSNRISMLIYNVRYDSREVEALRDLIRDTDPDIILLSEPTRWWQQQLAGLEEYYPYTLLQPQENKYGKLLYSRLSLEAPEIRFMIGSEIPSIRTKVRLRSGTLVTFYGVHPRPPGLHRPEQEQGTGIKKGDEGDGEREDSDMRDAELQLIAREIMDQRNIPVIVAGDFNDVPWSRSFRHFQRIGGLLDPRVGRGFFNTFSPGNILLRYPLDGALASRHFRLVEIRRLPDIGSDHFPLLVVLDYDPNASATNKEPKPDESDKDESDEAIEEGISNEKRGSP